MNERERWIVYPLLFFALGASLRDKFLQHVSTKEIECTRLVAKEIACGELVVTDPAKADRVVARLTSGMPRGAPTADRFGMLVLIDSEGKELCGVTNNTLQVREVNCEGVHVVDPDNNTRVLAGLGSYAVAGEDGKPRRFGVLALNNEDFGTLTGNPPRGVIKAPADDEKPADEAPAAEDKPEDAPAPKDPDAPAEASPDAA